MGQPQRPGGYRRSREIRRRRIHLNLHKTFFPTAAAAGHGPHRVGAHQAFLPSNPVARCRDWMPGNDSVIAPYGSASILPIPGPTSP